MFCSAIVTVIWNSASNSCVHSLKSEKDRMANANENEVYNLKWVLEIKWWNLCNYFFFNFLEWKLTTSERRHLFERKKGKFEYSMWISNKELLFLYIVILRNADHYSVRDICAWYFFISVNLLDGFVYIHTVWIYFLHPIDSTDYSEMSQTFSFSNLWH